MPVDHVISFVSFEEFEVDFAVDHHDACVVQREHGVLPLRLLISSATWHRGLIYLAETLAGPIVARRYHPFELIEFV